MSNLNDRCVSDVSLSSDFISGFCGETEGDHEQTLSLIKEVGYNVGFLFAYSMRQVSSWLFGCEITDMFCIRVKQNVLSDALWM